MFPADRYFYFITVIAENTALYKYSGQNGKRDSRTLSERVTQSLLQTQVKSH